MDELVTLGKFTYALSSRILSAAPASARLSCQLFTQNIETPVTPINMRILLSLPLLLFSLSLIAYEPETCRQTSCQINAGDYIEVALTGPDAVESWAFADGFSPLEGMSVNPRTGVLTWTPTNEQDGPVTIDIDGKDAGGNVITSPSRQVVVTVAANSSINWDAIKFATTNNFASTNANSMDGSLSDPFSLDKFGGAFCNTGETRAETIYFRGGLHTTEFNDNPAPLNCSGESLENPLILKPWGNEKPILSPKHTEALKINGDFITIDGFEIAGYNDQITLDQALNVWWSEANPATPAGYVIIAQGILAKGNGIVIKNNIVHSWPGNGIKVQGDLSSVINNIVFNSGYYSTRGVGGVMVEGLNDSSYPVPAGREFGTIVKDNVIFGNESRIISHVFSKGFSTLEIDEGSGINLQQNNGNYTRKYLVENNAILFNGKGPGLRAKDITFRNNTVVGNGLNLRVPSSAGVRLQKISTSGLASNYQGDAGATAAVLNNIISVPPNHEAIRIDADSRPTECSGNVSQGIYTINAKNQLIPEGNTDSYILCSEQDNNRFIVNSPVKNSASNDFTPVSGGGGASQSLIVQASARLADIGFSLKPSGFDIMSIHAYEAHIMPMINTILKTTPDGSGGSTQLIYKDGAGNLVSGVDLADENYDDLSTVELVEFTWSGNPPEYNSGKSFDVDYRQILKLPPDDRYAITGSVDPIGAGDIECSDISVRVTKTQRPLDCLAVARDGYAFSGWSGDCSGTSCSFEQIDSEINVIAMFVANDSDNDGIPDDEDNCPLIGNADQTNTDSDANGNACDDDDDNDDIPDGEDGYPLIAIGDRLDTDGDGIPNDCDTDCAGMSADADDDNDGVDDTSDAFPLDPTEQSDTDLDGVGDNGDNCPTAPNPNQTNFDGDSLGDLCDPDDDNDGLTDTQEVELGTDRVNRDSDGDGWSDKEEVDAGTDPLQASSQPESSSGLPIWLLYQATQ